MLNLFQKGQSHVAVVVKSKTALSDPARSTFSMHEMIKRHNSDSSLTQIKVEKKGITYQNKQLNIYRSSSDAESQNPASDQNISNLILGSPPNPDEEIIGLITMEDVPEELLQEPILDETDQYVDVDNLMQINLLRSTLRSGATSASNLDWKTLVASPTSSSTCSTPISSHHLTPVLRSPLPPFIHSPFTKPTLYSSPTKSVPNSPVAPVSSSPSSHLVSRKT